MNAQTPGPTESAQTLLSAAEAALALSPSKAVTLAREAAERAAESNDTILLARAHLLCGMGLRRLGDLVSAQQMMQQAEALFVKAGDRKYLHRVWQARAAVCNAAGQIDDAIELLQRAMPLARENNDTQTQHRVLTTWAVALIRKGQYTDAIAQLEEALGVLAEHPDEGAKTVVLNAFGSIYQRSSNYDLALRYFHESLEVSRRLMAEGRNEARNRCASLICIADTLLTVGRENEAKPYLDEALTVSREQDLMDVQASVLKCYGDRELAEGRYREAIPHYTEAAELLDATGNGMIMITVLNQLAECYMKVSDYALAEQTLERVLALQGPNASPEHEFITHQALAELYALKGDHASATKHYKLAIASHVRLFSEANQRVLRETEKRAEVESALREKDLMKAHAEEMSKSRDALKALNERQIEILRIVSHDMRNPLGAIVGMAGELSRDDSVSLADARIIAHVIEGSAQKLVALTDELLLAAQLETGALRPKHTPVSIDELVQRSIDLIRPHAANKGVQVNARSTERENRVAALDIEIVSHVLNNLLSNAVKFTSAGGSVSVDVGTDSSTCTIRVIDTGIGIPDTLMPTLFDPFNPARRPGTENEKGTGLGLPLVKQLIDLEGGSIEVASGSQRGTTVTVTLPLKTD